MTEVISFWCVSVTSISLLVKICIRPFALLPLQSTNFNPILQQLPLYQLAWYQWSVQLRKNISASLSSFERFCTVACLLKSRQLISVWQRWMKWSQEENWLDGGYPLRLLWLLLLKDFIVSGVLVGSLCSRLSLVAPGSSTGPSFSLFWFWKNAFSCSHLKNFSQSLVVTHW